MKLTWQFSSLALVGLLSAPGSLAQQPLLQITSPSAGAVITEGQTITITVSAAPSVQIADVVTNGLFPDVQAGSSANQFLLTIPTNITPGTYYLTAVGLTSSGDVESQPVAIDVEPQYYPSQPLSVAPESPVFNFTAVGDELPIRVIGSFSDGSTLDVTRSSNTS
jgi:hypothetical protein